MDQRGHWRVDWGHLALLAVICGVTTAYLFDARSTSLKINNLLLVEPAALLALVLALVVLPQCFRRPALSDQADPETTSGSEPKRGAQVVRQTEGWRPLLKVGLLMAGFGALVFSLETVGFDVATFLFMVGGLWLCGERRIWVIGLFSAVFTAAIIYGYQQLVPYPFPLLVL